MLYVDIEESQTLIEKHQHKIYPFIDIRLRKHIEFCAKVQNTIMRELVTYKISKNHILMMIQGISIRNMTNEA